MINGEILSQLPDKPGVYLFKNAEGRVVYVGKAKSLTKRVRSYFLDNLAPKTRLMMNQAADLDFIITDSEVEALILENNLIKKHRPRYNIRLRDDKTYPYLRVTWQEPFPKIEVTRRVLKDGARYYGPYADSSAMNETLALLKKIFPLKRCNRQVPAKDGKPCLNFHIKRCPGPCRGDVDPGGYRAVIEQVCLFLEGREGSLMKKLAREMEKASEAMDFEQAAEIRDKIQAIQKVLARQKMVTTSPVDQDVMGMAREGLNTCIHVFFVRSGKLVGAESYFPEGAEELEDGAVLNGFVKQFYGRAEYVPGQVLLPAPVEDEQVIEEWLARRAGRKVSLKVPQRGEKRELVKLAALNARKALVDRVLRTKKDIAGPGLEGLREALGLAGLPQRIECYDISNIQGTDTVASQVVFTGGKPDKDEYRRYRIATADGPDDFASMAEVIGRRFRRAREEGGPLPDLVIIDGGKGQLGAAHGAMQEAGYGGVPVFGLAKEEELLFGVGEKEPIALPRTSPALQLLQQVRDEAHRFAVSYHRKLRGKRSLRSALDDIPGIGPKRRSALLKAFKSLDAMAEASVEEIAAVAGMTKPTAEKVYAYLHSVL